MNDINYSFITAVEELIRKHHIISLNYNDDFCVYDSYSSALLNLTDETEMDENLAHNKLDSLYYSTKSIMGEVIVHKHGIKGKSSLDLMQLFEQLFALRNRGLNVTFILNEFGILTVDLRYHEYAGGRMIYGLKKKKLGSVNTKETKDFGPFFDEICKVLAGYLNPSFGKH
jgi:hypothetical protein